MYAIGVFVLLALVVGYSLIVKSNRKVDMASLAGTAIDNEELRGEMMELIEHGATFGEVAAQYGVKVRDVVAFLGEV